MQNARYGTATGSMMTSRKASGLGADLPGALHIGVQGPPGPPGPQGPAGPAGDDYALTEDDMAEIAEMAAELVEVPEHSGGNVDLTGYATEKYVREYAQPKGDYLTEVPEGSALPPVTAENNGAFLRVVDGAWAVATIPSAEGVSF